MKLYEVIYVDPKSRRLLSTAYAPHEGFGDKPEFTETEAIEMAVRFAQGLMDEGHVSFIRERPADPITPPTHAP